VGHYIPDPVDGNVTSEDQLRVNFIEDNIEMIINKLMVHYPDASDVTDFNVKMVQDIVMTVIRQDTDLSWLAKTVDNLHNSNHEAIIRIIMIRDFLKDISNADMPPLNILVLQHIGNTVNILNNTNARG
jgi:hypothetical protein